jgi:hypothetical protein
MLIILHGLSIVLKQDRRPSDVAQDKQGLHI